MNNDVLQSVLDIVRACDAVQLCTIGDEYPETRHVANAMNKNADNLTLYFMTGRNTPKARQLANCSKCCLYYFNDSNRHAVRLFGNMEFVTDMATRRAHWHDDFKKFGYGGPDDADVVLLRFVPAAYKFYVGDEMKTGNI